MRSDAEVLEYTMKQAMRRLAASVCVISTRNEHGRYAMSATAVTSLTMTPPALLVCVNRATPFHSAMEAASRFCVNILRAGQSEIATACGGRLQGEEKFSTGQWVDGPYQIPLLQDAQASLICDTCERFEYGTHSIFVGRVMDIRLAEPVAPLIYVNAAYAAVAPLEQVLASVA